MSEGEQKRKLVYVVDDDEEQLALLRLLLNGAGFNVVTESNADQVHEGIRRWKPEVVLLDVMLPGRRGIDGFQICTEVKADPACAGTRIVIVSAIAEGAGSQRERIRDQIGADDYILKPYEPSVLVERIRELLLS